MSEKQEKNELSIDGKLLFYSELFKNFESFDNRFFMKSVGN